MKSQLNKIYIIIFVILFFTLSKSNAIEDVKEFTDAINEASEKFNNISEASTEQSKIIDEAFKEIDKATEYVQEAINSGNAEDAIKTLEFIEKSLSDVENIIPQEFSSDMSNIDTEAIAKEDMDIITEMTTQMGVAKEKKQTEFMSGLMDLNLKGIDTVSISENLNGMGIDTIKLVLDVDGADKLETWTKEQWAQSYTGSIVTSSGNEAIPDNEIGNKVVDLEKQLQANNDAIFDKRNSLTELQTKIDPLSNQITGLQTQKSSLLAKYNEEILKQSSTILSDEEIGQSKDLANQLNNQLSEITSNIEVAETQSNLLQQQAQSLNLELTNEIASKTQLENNIRNLNNQFSANQNILSQKTSELDRLKNTDLNRKASDLNDNLERATLQRDFAQRDFDKVIDKEVDAFSRYYSALGEVDADNYDIQAEYAVREVQAILNPDPKQYRAFELEKYSKLAGLPQSVIDEGVAAIQNDDWIKQKAINKKILKALEKNPQSVLPKDWYFNKSTDGDINIMIAEDKAIQEAVYTSIELNNVKEKVSLSIAEKTKDIQPLASLNAVNLERFGVNSLREGTREYEFFQKERDLLISGEMGEKMKAVTENLSTAQNEMNQIVELNQQKRETINKVTARVQKEINSNNSKISGLQSELTTNKNNFYESYNAAVLEVREKIYGPGGSVMGGPTEEFEKLDFAVKSELFDKLDGLKRGEHAIRFANVSGITKDLSGLTPEMKKLGNKMNQTVYEIEDIKDLNLETSKEITKTVNENKQDWDKYYEVSGELRIAQFSKIEIDNEIKQLSAKNLVESVKEAQTEYNQIIAEESKELTEYQNKISSILKEIPTFENNADSLVDLDPVRLRAKLVDLAGNGNINETAAVEAALKELGEIGDAPVSKYMTGPYWESSNIKTAAIVRSKKYTYVDDYAYTNAYYDDPLEIDSANREVLEGELKDVLGSSNPVLDALNEKVESLSTEVNLTKDQSQNLASEMAKLENELTSLKNSEGDLQNQINDLTNQFNSKESLITEKTQNLASIQEQLNPINDRVNNLQGQRAELDGKLNDQLNTITDQVKDQGQVTDEAKELKAKFESQIAELDNQLKDYENQSVEINGQLTSITTELSVLETENPELANQIASLNQDLENFTEIKAELAMATAKKLGINVDETTLKSVKVIDGKVIISIEGTDLISVVDQGMLVDNAQDFIDPLSKLSINTKVYSAKALNRELVTPEFIQAAKSISVSKQIEVIAQSTAVENVGATTEQSKAFATAKAARLSARKEWDVAVASGDKVAAQAAENAFMAAKSVEQTASLNAAAAVAASSVASQATSAASVASQATAAATEAAQEVSQVASAAAKEAASEVKETVQAAAKSAQEAALSALWEMEAMPGGTGTQTLEVTAAIRQLQAEMNGNEFNYLGEKSYEAAMEKIKSNANDPNAISRNWDYEANPEGHDPNRIGKCGKASC